MLSLANSRPAFFLIICSVATLDSALTICIFEVLGANFCIQGCECLLGHLDSD